MLQILNKMNERSTKYIYDAKNGVYEHNRKLLIMLNVIYLFVLAIYNVIVPIFFAGWNVTRYYRGFFLGQIVVLVIIHTLLLKKEIGLNQLQTLCMVFHLYVMLFVVVISVIPFDTDQPAMYFAPILIGFSVVFTLKFYTILSLILIDTVALNIATFLFKPTEAFNINLYASILSAFIAGFLVYTVYDSFLKTAEAKKEIEMQSKIDPLTGIYNRGALEKVIEGKMERHPNRACALVMIDVDLFKKINDKYGHQKGDEVLTKVAAILTDAVGTQNAVGRIGGDEFMLFINHGTDRDNLVNICAQIERKANAIYLSNTSRRKVSCSIGIYEVHEGETAGYEEMFKKADEALYVVKKNGRGYFDFYEDITKKQAIEE